MHVFLVLFALVVLWQAKDLLFDAPACGYCHRKREHARDCPLRKK